MAKNVEKKGLIRFRKKLNICKSLIEFPITPTQDADIDRLNCNFINFDELLRIFNKYIMLGGDLAREICRIALCKMRCLQPDTPQQSKFVLAEEKFISITRFESKLNTLKTYLKTPLTATQNEDIYRLNCENVKFDELLKIFNTYIRFDEDLAEEICRIALCKMQYRASHANLLAFNDAKNAYLLVTKFKQDLQIVNQAMEVFETQTLKKAAV